jgi:hypothetical protein
MGLRDFWSRLRGGDKLERVEEELEADRAEQPAPVQDYEAMKDDVSVEERYPGGERGDFESVDRPPESEKW